MLKLAREGITAEHIEKLSYSPGLQDSGDLEPATKTITATAEASGIANADYCTTLTLPSPSDARLMVQRIAARLVVTIDSMTAGQINCRVYVDAQDADHRLFDLPWASAGAKLAAVDTHTGNLATIFGLLNDGAAHTVYFFFWVDAGNAVVSLCQIWEAVGSCTTEYWGMEVLALTHAGLVSTADRLQRVGTGQAKQMLLDGGFTQGNFIKEVGNVSELAFADSHCLVGNGVHLWLGGSVATDLNYIWVIHFTLRSEQ